MTISRMQQPRQMYGLGSLVKSAVKGVKDFVKSDIGKATILGVGAFGLPGGFGGITGLIPQTSAIRSFLPNLLLGKERAGMLGERTGGLFGKFSEMGNFGKAATMFGIGSLGGGALAALEAAGLDTDNPNEMPRDIEALKAYLRQGYKQLNQDASPEQVEAFVTANTTEYAANGGRIGFADGMPREGIETLLPKPKPSEMMQGVDKTIQSIDNFAQLIAQSGSPSDMRGHMDLFSDFIQKNNVDAGPAFQYLKNRVKELKPGMERYIYISNEDMPVQKAMGGRIGFAFGNPEQNAMEASGIGGLPLNQNPAGVKELDLRDSGGFIPPVGVKEKADDIPAMLSNNEFVFTADAVRGMGDGDVEKGAQRMYDMMKKLEGGGRV